MNVVADSVTVQQRVELPPEYWTSGGVYEWTHIAITVLTTGPLLLVGSELALR